MKKTVYGVFVAINDYPHPDDQLQGCVPDMRAFKAYLENYTKTMGWEFKAKRPLTNAGATREHVIKQFEHFKQATKDDICIFFYAGHGSEEKAPENFWFNNSSGKVEGMICYDSRTYGETEGQGDLLSKELSYLIWKNTKDNDPHFVAIMDCCYSGMITRDLKKVKERIVKRVGQDRKKLADEKLYHRLGKERMASESKEALEKERLKIYQELYLGFEDYKKHEDGTYSPPEKAHILLAAALPNETAKEIINKSESRGAFSFSLMETLKKSGGQISYRNLMSKTNIAVRNRVKEQSPQLFTRNVKDQKAYFLNTDKRSNLKLYTISYDVAAKSWVVNAGALDGILLGDGKEDTTFTFKDKAGEEHSVSVNHVELTYSKLSGMDAFDDQQHERFDAKLEAIAMPKMPVAIHMHDGQEDAKKALEDYMTDSPSDYLDLVEPEKARYWIHVDDGTFYIAFPYEKVPKPLFKRVKGTSDRKLKEFVVNLESVAKWVQVLEMDNPATSLDEDDVEVIVERVVDTNYVDEDGFYDEGSKTEVVQFEDTVELPYLKKGDQWINPGYKVSIKNNRKSTTDKPLYFSVLYMSRSFEIYNGYLPSVYLKEGQEKKLEDKVDDEIYEIMTLMIEDAYQAQGINEIEEYLKIFISTDEINTDHMNQESLELDEEALAERGRRRRKKVKNPDWTTKLVRLKITHPGV